MQAPLFDMMVLQGGVFMALLSCPECGNEVSSNADFCPQCGYSFKTQSQRKVMYNVLPFVFFGIGALCVLLLPETIGMILGLILFNVGFFVSFKSQTNAVKIISIVLCVIGILFTLLSLISTVMFFVITTP